MKQKEKKKLTLNISPDANSYSEWIIDINVKYKTIKCLKEIDEKIWC